MSVVISDLPLLDCPFCGSQPEIRKRATVLIECKLCHAILIRMSIDEAVASWNRRPCTTVVTSTVVDTFNISARP